MDSRNETYSRQWRFMDETYFLSLYDAFIAAFADYVMPFDLSEQQFRNHIVLNAVDLASSVGIIEGEKLVGFTINGFGKWNGRQTVYDAGTGVLPEFRRRGMGLTMFDVMMPIFKDRGIEQYLLEVVTTNKNAISMYEKLGFGKTRTLSLLELSGQANLAPDALIDIELRDIDDPDWDLLQTFWDGDPSWQNSILAVKRSLLQKRFIGAFHENDCLGYIIFAANSGRIAQIAVDQNYRGLGIGSLLLKKLLSESDPTARPQVVNIDRSLHEAMAFFENRGFKTKLSQFEMIRAI
ncbi:MAG: GNAT family N-acetyltransferase [Pyrinomonadaceae bacterium]|nr:GNAT family N-acetyltransferase [Pyrinomonadaceae bacterium]